MNRVTAVAATLATAAAATMAAATMGPAMAAPRAVAAHPAAHAKTTTAHARDTPAKTTAKQAKPTSSLPTEIASELDGGKYVTIVRCQGVDSPPPVHLGKPGTPLIVSGGGPSTAISKMLKQADPYKDIYTCTILVEEKVPAKPAAVTKKIAAHKVRGCEIATGGGTRCTKKVTLNTGFGGLAPQVTHHHPAG